MTDKDSKQSLIPHDDNEQWLKVMHGEKRPDADDDTQREAESMRRYLIERDEEKALENAEQFNTLTPDEARVIFDRAHAELNPPGDSWFKRATPYISGATFSLLLLAGGYGLYQYFQPQKDLSSFSDLDTRILKDPAFRMLGPTEALKPYPNMVGIPGGTVEMGCKEGWDDIPGGCKSYEKPSHKISIKSFAIAQHEVTVPQFRLFVEKTGYKTTAESTEAGSGCVFRDLKKPGANWEMVKGLSWRNPGYQQNDDSPVSCMSWLDAHAYIDWLSKELGKQYRLPTEAEWEYAARGRKNSANAYFWGDMATHNDANFNGADGIDQWEYAGAVGKFPANDYGVQDTAGNLWEWVQDCWHESYVDAPTDGSAWEEECDEEVRVRRGGSWFDHALNIRSAQRGKGGKADRSFLYGFRVAHDWTPKTK